ncbi:hypothetical protein V3Q90_00020 [Flavobacterium oreochromis]|uniref:hypothetical protein n=1 Tax=Flavobacterium oreochromis TaxID=2906078 RepID=UPI00385FD211
MMIKSIRESRVTKVFVWYLMILFFLESTNSLSIYALTNGPKQPEFESFTPISASEMVDLSSGDLNYNIPIMDVGGYPINLAYNTGITMDQEASWVGLGWDLSAGQIARNMRGIPDDFNGDGITYENSMKDNITVGGNFNMFLSPFGFAENGDPNSGLKVNTGIDVKYNNYDGVTFSCSKGISYAAHNGMTVGVQMNSSIDEGVSISPSISYSHKINNTHDKDNSLGASLGCTYNSRKGMENMSLSISSSRKGDDSFKKDKNKNEISGTRRHNSSSNTLFGSSYSFVNSSYTPTKRLGMRTSSYDFNFNLETPLWGIDPGFKIGGYKIIQGLDDSEKYKTMKSFGYENTHRADLVGVLDFNREKDRVISPYTTLLPQTNYTYDQYSIQGHGISGSFRPFRGKVGVVYDNYVVDVSKAFNLGVEIGIGGGTHFGFNATTIDTHSYTKLWENNALSRFIIDKRDQLDFEEVYFKGLGSLSVDKDKDLFNDHLGSYQSIRFNLTGGDMNRNISSEYYRFDGYGRTKNRTSATAVLARNSRVNRNQAIQKITEEEVAKYGYAESRNHYAKKHHTVQYRVRDVGGNCYVYGKALYNITKKEASFDMSGGIPDSNKGLIDYIPESDNSTANSRKGDQYFNRITTPAYVHTYLLTSILSSDYQDLKNDGVTDDDLGSYTKIEYANNPNSDPNPNGNIYKWRIPYGKNKANFNTGLFSNPKDDKASYTYGEKELAYIKKIETKTHVAIFKISKRKDNYGVLDENGGFNSESMSYKLDKIKLYSKAEYNKEGDKAIPIKVAHFVYDYSLCLGVENNSGSKELDSNEMENQGGKLTLKKIYFTYRNSNMGEFTPYTFEYANNKRYDMRSYDMWSNYKKENEGITSDLITSPLTNAEFPYVEQNQSKADENTSSWTLNKINLPSGGVIQVDYESDDYRYVQNKEVMQMFKVIGCGNESFQNLTNTSGLTSADYIYVQLDKPVTNENEFRNKYIRNLINQSLYFRFLLNMTNPNPLPGSSTDQKYDFVTGYATLSGQFKVNSSNPSIVAIGLNKQDLNKSSGGTPNINPITKAGYNFGRTNLHKLVFSLTNNMDNTDIKDVIINLIGTLATQNDIFSSPNRKLKNNDIASSFIPNKSWVRLMHPDNKKLGGGCRVKEIRLLDNWDVMTNNDNNDNYSQFYGQQYNYKDKEGYSSGVASYEPLGSKENPLITPIWDENNPGALLSPEEQQNYTEGPVGESFFPSPRITYSRVEVKNLPREEKRGDDIYQVKKHATGKVVTEFFTTKDYPTIVSVTPIASQYDKTPVLASLLSIETKDHLTLSQGFTVHTNDMDGKMKSQRVYPEGDSQAISGIDYIYYNKDNATVNSQEGLLDNEVTTINKNGTIESNIVGVDYDVVNDFRENSTVTENVGIAFNLEGLPLAVVYIIIPSPIPSYSHHETVLKTAATTKLIHSSGILRETITYDLGSTVSTKNLAFDAETGEVLVTQTVNEYNDNYYTLNYPAYWNYKTMGQAITNLNISCNVALLNGSKDNYIFTPNLNASKFLVDGDLVFVNCKTINDPDSYPESFKAWVVNVKENGSFDLIDSKGIKINDTRLLTGSIKVIQSAYKNLQTSSMASVTSMINPLATGRTNLTGIFDSDSWGAYRIINASAIEYSNVWPGPCESGMPLVSYDSNNNMEFEYNKKYNQNQNPVDRRKRTYNPYLYNILGNWRANKSYAYLTGRNTAATKTTPRISGYFNDFHPFYQWDIKNNKWVINREKWQYASEVSLYNNHGQEIENKDALERHSAALFGYNYKLPLAVGSNTKYSELGFDNFEDYDQDDKALDTKSHFNFQNALKENVNYISSKHSHSGRKSLRVAPIATAKIERKIKTCSSISTIKK